MEHVAMVPKYESCSKLCSLKPALLSQSVSQATPSMTNSNQKLNSIFKSNSQTQVLISVTVWSSQSVWMIRTAVKVVVTAHKSISTNKQTVKWEEMYNRIITAVHTIRASRCAPLIEPASTE